MRLYTEEEAFELLRDFKPELGSKTEEQVLQFLNRYRKRTYERITLEHFKLMQFVSQWAPKAFKQSWKGKKTLQQCFAIAWDNMQSKLRDHERPKNN